MSLELSGNKLLVGINARSNALSRPANALFGIVPAPAKASAPVERQQGSAGALSIGTGETEGFQSNSLMLDNIIDISNTFDDPNCDKCRIKTRRKRGSAIVCITSGFPKDMKIISTGLLFLHQLAQDLYRNHGTNLSLKYGD
jgi:hypothetical protein